MSFWEVLGGIGLGLGGAALTVITGGVAAPLVVPTIIAGGVAGAFTRSGVTQIHFGDNGNHSNPPPQPSPARTTQAHPPQSSNISKPCRPSTAPISKSNTSASGCGLGSAKNGKQCTRHEHSWHPPQTLLTGKETAAELQQRIANEAEWHASSNPSKGCCSMRVREAIERALDIDMPGADAKYLGPSLTAAGFRKVTVSGSKYQNGDVIIFQDVKNHEYGHASVYTEKGWVSDFKQKSIYVAPEYKKGTHQVYRYDPPSKYAPPPNYAGMETRKRKRYEPEEQWHRNVNRKIEERKKVDHVPKHKKSCKGHAPLKKK